MAARPEELLMAVKLLPAERRKARSFLYSHHKRGFGIPPEKFAAASKELGVSFRELMRFISILYARGQGGGAFRIEALRNLAQQK
jgi:hypothetical protein